MLCFVCTKQRSPIPWLGSHKDRCAEDRHAQSVYYTSVKCLSAAKRSHGLTKRVIKSTTYLFSFSTLYTLFKERGEEPCLAQCIFSMRAHGSLCPCLCLWILYYLDRERERVSGEIGRSILLTRWLIELCAEGSPIIHRRLHTIISCSRGRDVHTVTGPGPGSGFRYAAQVQLYTRSDVCDTDVFFYQQQYQQGKAKGRSCSRSDHDHVCLWEKRQNGKSELPWKGTRRYYNKYDSQLL